jgi:serine phosphatase RsbU (regulator of sigma subunit)
VKQLLSILIISVICLQGIAQYNDSILLQHISNQDTTGQINRLCELAELYVDSTSNASMILAEEAYDLSQMSLSSTDDCTALFALGIAHQAKSQYQKALEFYIQSYECAEISSNAKIRITSSNNIGMLNRMTGNTEKALEWYKITLSLSEEKKDTTYLIYALNNIGNIENTSGNYHEAIEWYQKCIDEIKKSGSHDYMLSTVFPNMAYAYYAIDEKENAIKIYKETLNQTDGTNSPYKYAVILKSLAEIYHSTGDNQTALIYLNKAGEYYTKIDNKHSEQSYYFLRYKVELALGNHQAALKDLEKYQRLQDSIDISEMHVLLTDIQEKYDNEKLRHKNLVQEEIIKKRNRILLYISSLVVLLVFLFIISIRINRYRKKTNHILQQQQETINEGLQYGHYVKDKLMSPENFTSANIQSRFVYNQPKGIVGGDFYLFKQHTSGDYVILGDATGHGIPGGFISLSVLSTFHQLLRQEDNLSANTLLSRVLEMWETESSAKNIFDESFTASVLKINPNEIEIANYRQKSLIISNGEYIVHGKKTSILSKIQTNTLKVQKGDWIILSSDGYYDQIGEKSQKTYQFKQFAEMITTEINHYSTNIEETLKKEHLQHKGNQEQTDDILVIGIGF